MPNQDTIARELLCARHLLGNCIWPSFPGKNSNMPMTVTQYNSGVLRRYPHTGQAAANCPLPDQE